MSDIDDQLKALREQTEQYSKLSELAKTPGFKDYLDFQAKTVVGQILGVFVGPTPVKDWDEFLKVRGEIMAKFYTLQELGGADQIIALLQEQIKQYLDPPKF